MIRVGTWRDPAEVRSGNPILRYFEPMHAGESVLDLLRDIDRAFDEFAFEMAAIMDPGPELTEGLRKLLEARDCMIRAAL